MDGRTCEKVGLSLEWKREGVMDSKSDDDEHKLAWAK